MNRRQLLRGLPALGGLTALARPGSGQTTSSSKPAGLPLEQYEPKSMLHAAAKPVERARFPVIDFHTHITSNGELQGGAHVRFAAQPPDLLPLMDRRNVRTMVNLTGGTGPGLKEAIDTLQSAHPGRFVVFTEPTWNQIANPRFPQMQADAIQSAHAAGAKGIKLLKVLGLYLREHVTQGKLVAVDDRRFDPMWETAASLGMPIAIHTSDPEAFFLPIDRFNERWEELHGHPDWSFYGKDFPSNRELQEARRRVMRRHPKTQFVCLHVADAEDLAYVGECLDELPNMSVDIAARIGELGRQPRAARRFLDRYQDRVVFGTDAIPNGKDTPQQIFTDGMYKIYYRFLETEDEYFDYAPSRVPPQGRWRIYGVGLPDPVLKKIYFENSTRLLRL